MILKKPYAFLIKNFKKIHIILLFLLVYIAYKSVNINSFFNNYFKNETYEFTTSLATDHINILMFFCIVIVIIFGLILFWLMHIKQKKKIFYFILMISYFLIFASLVYLFGVFAQISDSLVDERITRAARDISLLILIPQIYCIIYTIIRALGFDIKKFEFGRDLKELDISSTDNEEFEFALGKEGYKTKRTFRKAIKELKYYFIENKYMIGLVTLLIAFITTIILYFNFQVFNKKYDEKAPFTLNGLTFKVSDSYITKNSYNGIQIDQNNKYIIAKINIENKGSEKQILEIENFKLIIGKDTYYPTTAKYNYFIDLGKGYKEQVQEPNNDNFYILVFQIPKKKQINNPTFRIVNNIFSLEGGFSARNKDSILKPKNMDKIQIEEYKLNEEINFKDSLITNTKLNIKEYEIKETIDYVYKYCINAECYNGTTTIKPSDTTANEKAILRLKILFQKSNAILYKSINSKNVFMTDYTKLTYKTNNKYKQSTIKDVTPKIVKGENIYFEVNKDALNSLDKKLNLQIRNKKYVIALN